MHRRMVKFLGVFVCLSLGYATSGAQALRLFDRDVQVHGFASQGFVYTGANNWLTMDSSEGSAAFTDFGVNVSSNVTDKLRVGAQLYDRNLGHFGNYHPVLDWAVADYRLKSWLGVRGGKVKTTRGLYNDSQDLDFLHPFVLLPQSVYPTDLRDSTIAHVGGDVYGDIALKHRLGDLSYTVYAGHRSDSTSSGYPYLLSQFGTHFRSYGGLQYGADLRWKTPLKGLLIGVSRMNEEISGKGTAHDPLNFTGPIIPYSETSKADWTNQFYGEFAVGKLHIDSEYRRYWRDQLLFGEASEDRDNVRGWYVSGSYRLVKRLTVGSYYSRYTLTEILSGVLSTQFPNQTDSSLPANHIYDKVVSARYDANRLFDVKLEGHFMNGYGVGTYPEGFYPQVNPHGFTPDTNALVAKVGFNF